MNVKIRTHPWIVRDRVADVQCCMGLHYSVVRFSPTTVQSSSIADQDQHPPNSTKLLISIEHGRCLHAVNSQRDRCFSHCSYADTNKSFGWDLSVANNAIRSKVSSAFHDSTTDKLWSGF